MTRSIGFNDAARDDLTVGGRVQANQPSRMS
jgi:hypothetical protein